ncbi:hypothetical protein MM236_02185 [Belliella sp. DSM 107340]|uniref:Uncharacterized protein n=1 Tax=Belliella calami TaxID=2923436 RepID=A0ABS9UKK6_9BACT|nr:hypothetical protein [Belliella calami]MCH7396773.1 hypothetical protein [Belliella calami]
MRNNLFWTTFRFNTSTTLTLKDIEENLFNDKISNLFRFSLLKSHASQIVFSYNLMQIQVMRIGLVLSGLEAEERNVKVRFRLSNILLLVFVLQLAMSFACFIVVALYVDDPALKVFFTCLPLFVYIIMIANFQFFKSRVLKRLKEIGIYLLSEKSR